MVHIFNCHMLYTPRDVTIMNMLRNTSGGWSLSRTQAALGFLVSSGVVIWQAYQGTLTETVFIAYFGFCVGGYVGAKKIAVDKQNRETANDNP